MRSKEGKKVQKTDCLIIGAGIAGITAAIYLKRSNLSAVLLDKDAPGGKLNSIHRIDNYPGFTQVAGPDLAMHLYEQATSLGIEFTYGSVSEVKLEDGLFHVTTDVEEYLATTLIVATGIENKKLGVPGEAELNGKGVSYCATCDGNFFKGKDVVVYGYKDRAVEDAIYLSSLAKTVYMLAPHPLEATEAHRNELLEKKNVVLHERMSILSILGEDHVIGVHTYHGGQESDLACDGVFQLYGEKSSSQFLSSLGLETSKGFIKVDASMATSVPGLYAAGDVIDKRLRQLVNAAGEAAVAATSAISYIHAKKKAA